MHTYTVIGSFVFLGTFLLTLVGIWKVAAKAQTKTPNAVVPQDMEDTPFEFSDHHQSHIEKFKNFLKEMEQKGDFNPQKDQVEFSIHRDGRIKGQQMDIEDFMNY